jgi:hypothetical protein
VPSHSSTISGCETQNGAGITTSSPGLIVATIALYSTCLPPELIVIDRSSLELAVHRAFQLDPAVKYGVFRVARIDRGFRRLLNLRRRVEIGFTDRQADNVRPAAFGSVASAVIALVGDGLTRARRSARNGIIGLAYRRSGV